jgi:hypothetical protein
LPDNPFAGFSRKKVVEVPFISASLFLNDFLWPVYKSKCQTVFIDGIRPRTELGRFPPAAKLEQLRKGVVAKGILPEQNVTIVDASFWRGSDAALEFSRLTW